MTKAPLGGKSTGPNPTDRAKGGVKRSLLCEGRGAPIGLAVDGANRNDFKMARATLKGIPIRRPRPTRRLLQGLCLDKGYHQRNIKDEAASHTKKRKERLRAAGAAPKLIDKR
jgi:hypothetical protein